MVHVKTRVSGPPPEVIEGLREFTAATVYEASGRVGCVDHRIRPIAPGTKVAGSALTVECHPRDNLMLHKALQIAQPGDVIVAIVGGHVEAGYWGGLMTDSALARDLAGLVIDGCVRDGEEIVQKRFPVFSRGLCMRGTIKANLGTINHRIVFGGVIVDPGDVVLGDDDGLVVVARDRVDEVLEATRRRHEAEEEKSAALRAGTTSVELGNLDRIFDSLGLVEEKP
jgi:4-hydroxy-4-methyl-2-oxoglutarate aldolase